MRLTIFWRVILAQSAPIALMLAVSLYTLTQLHQFMQLSIDILSTDAVCIELEKRLLRTFLIQIRHAEKYVLLQDKVFYGYFAQGYNDFISTLEQIATLVDTPYERDVLDQVRDLQVRYAVGLSNALNPKSSWNQEKTAFSDKIIAIINDSIHFHEGMIAHKTAVARDHAATAAWMVRWLSLGGIIVAVLFAYCYARGISRPLKALTQALRCVGRGEFPPSLTIRAPKEVSELTTTFNWMATALAELDKMKTDFIAHVSHELRSPMTGIREGTALLLEQVPGPLTPGQRRILDVVQTHCERLWHHIASILDVSKIEAGMMEYQWGPSDLAALITRSLDGVRLLAQKKQLHLEVLCPAACPLLWLDEGRIQQVLDNLLSNAVKFTPIGGTIRISTCLEGEGATEGQRVVVRVTDTGIGIAAEERERIFDKFYQSASHSEARQAGTGLGLAIARHIVEAHGGEIWVESHLGTGATFVFTLPVDDLHRQGSQEAEDSPKERAMRWRRVRLMLKSALGLLFCCMLLVSGCASAPGLNQRYALFPPQEVIEDGDYARFRAANTHALEQCAEAAGCDVALFNLGFVYAYPPSPYYDPPRALAYFNDLVTRYPHTPWAAQGQAWLAVLNEPRAFPPQEVMKDGDFTRFHTVNRQVVERCEHPTRCDVALFNLGFVYAYPHSPYYNPDQALYYFGELVTRYPHTPWAVLGQAWITLLNAQRTVEETGRRLQADLDTKEATIRSKETVLRTKDAAMRAKDATIRSLQEQLDRTRDIDTQIDQTKDTAMRAKDATIRSLQEQLDRTRDIDGQIDQKERELLR